jgi:hypothetical protein
MAYVQNTFQTVAHTLVANVADDATFTVSYPSGTSQADFSAGLAGTGYAMVGSDRWEQGDPGLEFSFGASEITVTNRTGATLTAGTEITFQFEQANTGQDSLTLHFPISLAAITAAADVVTDYRPGVAGTIEYFAFLVDVAVTTAAKLASFNLEIGTTNVTGGVIALTSANATPKGKIIESTAITGANTLTPASKLSIESSAVTAFSEGSGTLIVRIRKS